MSELSPKARALFARTASRYEPTAGDRERLRRALYTRIAGPVAATAVTTASTAAASTSHGGAAASVVGKAGSSVVAKVLAGIVLVGGIGATTITLRHALQPMAAPPTARSSSASPSNATTVTMTAGARETILPPPAGSTAAPLAVPVDALPAAPVTKPRRVLAANTPSVSESAASTEVVRNAAESRPAMSDSLDDEMLLLRTAQLALREHDGARALDALDAHARRFPTGLLAEERAAARVLALCEAGRLAEAADARASFLTTHPSSPHVDRVRRSCARPSD